MSAEQTGSSPSGGSEAKPNPADFLAALARGEHPADATAEPASPLPGQLPDGQTTPAAHDGICGSMGQPAEAGDGELSLEPIEPGGETLAVAASVARPGRRRKHRPMSPRWRWAVIPLGIMAAAMLFIGGYAIAAIAGAVLVRQDDMPKVRMMLLAFPVALILIAGSAIIWMDTRQR